MLSMGEKQQLADDVVIIGGSMVGGGILASLISYAVFRMKSTQQTEHLTKLVANNDRSTADLKDKYETEIKSLTWQRQQEQSELSESIASLHADLTARERLMTLLQKSHIEFAAADTSSELWLVLLGMTRQVFSSDLHLICAVEPNSPFDVIAPEVKPSGDDAKILDILRKTVQESVSLEANHIRTWNASDLPGLKEANPELTTVAISVVAGRGPRLGHLILALKGEQHVERLNELRKVLEIFSQALFRMKMYEDEVRSSRIDFLTKLPNLKALHELLPPLLKTANSEKHVSVLLIECDSVKVINEKYGHLVGDELIKEMGAVIQASARFEELNSKDRPVDHLIRYCGTQFVLVLADTDVAFAMTVAERIRAAVDAKTDWYGGVPRWSVSVGMAIAPEDDRDYQLFLIKAEVALMYVKEKLGGNQVIAFNQVPRQYRVSKLSERVDGSLKVFDPFNMLQSMCSAGRTGILSVEERAGRRFWAFLDKSQVSKAHLGVLRGDWAIVEFLSTFDDGVFTFQEYSSLDQETMVEIHRMDDTFTVHKTVPKHLIDGTMAQEKLASARRLITNTRLFARPTREAADVIAGFPQLKPTPTREELDAMAAITKFVNGRTMLATIMERLEVYPTWLRWHGSAFLMQNGAMELSKLALSFSLENR
jgi:diguanylate cyclase (GGDEF)-like protein